MKSERVFFVAQLGFYGEATVTTVTTFFPTSNWHSQNLGTSMPRCRGQLHSTRRYPKRTAHSCLWYHGDRCTGTLCHQVFLKTRAAWQKKGRVTKWVFQKAKRKLTFLFEESLAMKKPYSCWSKTPKKLSYVFGWSRRLCLDDARYGGPWWTHQDTTFKPNFVALKSVSKDQFSSSFFKEFLVWFTKVLSCSLRRHVYQGNLNMYFGRSCRPFYGL